MHGHPILVAGKISQLARSLAEEGRLRGVPLIALGRPHLGFLPTPDRPSTPSPLPRGAPCP
jgi:hypothetical protein